MTEIKYAVNSKGQKISPYKSDPEVMKANYERMDRDIKHKRVEKGLGYGILTTIAIAIICMFLFSSCMSTQSSCGGFSWEAARDCPAYR